MPRLTSRKAALARLGNKREKSAAFNTSLAAIQAQVKRELEMEKYAAESSQRRGSSEISVPRTKELEASTHLATKGVYFRCPMVSDEILPKDEWKPKIREFLYEQLADERGLTSCLIIHSLNTKEKCESCCELLKKYLENIISHPDEEKYHKIRMSNRLFVERVKPVEGALDFLLAAGFVEQVCDGPDGSECYLVYQNTSEGTTNLEILLDALQSAEPLSLELDRCLQVLLPSQANKCTELPPAFYAITSEELKREQQQRTESIEKAQMLRTKAMREKDEMRELRRYKYALIRIRFPDGIFLQGTFSVYDKISQIFDFVRGALHNEKAGFTLLTPSSTILDNESNDQTLLDMKLVPATVLLFSYSDSSSTNLFLKPELMLLVQEI
ncbi:UBX domain-containing protein 6 [Ctenocephalides felis]|uniref:UBX domain-containing protein 6 n=1 Tax=Ctenocephalides felis TaxID=7515 RepID=UPI000E6E37C6|nr:UBX domain-containing protein 6 [Ctenocephalides felis]